MKSATHGMFGPGVRNWRWTRSSGQGAALSLIVARTGLPRMTPESPMPRIGRATVQNLAARGARLVLVARGREALEETAAEARALGAAEVLVCPADVIDADAVQRVVETAVARLGRLDAVVHSAQTMAYGRIEDVPREASACFAQAELDRPLER